MPPRGVVDAVELTSLRSGEGRLFRGVNRFISPAPVHESGLGGEGALLKHWVEVVLVVVLKPSKGTDADNGDEDSPRVYPCLCRRHQSMKTAPGDACYEFVGDLAESLVAVVVHGVKVNEELVCVVRGEDVFEVLVVAGVVGVGKVYEYDLPVGLDEVLDEFRRWVKPPLGLIHL